MSSLFSNLVSVLESHRLPGINGNPGHIHPYYNGLSISNIPSGLCALFGVPPINSAPSLHADILELLAGPYRNIVLLVVDGLGLEMLEQYLEFENSLPESHQSWKQLLSRSTFAPLTSIVPSTTSSALTSLWTGVTSIEHGIVGYEVWLKEYGLIANMITHAPAAMSGEYGSLKRAGFQNDTFLPVATLAPHLLNFGVNTAAFQPAAISNSSLSQMLLVKANLFPYFTISDMFVSAQQYLLAHPSGRHLLYLYLSDLDTLSHLRGPHDVRILDTLSMVGYQLSRFQHALPRRGDTMLLITADHGQLETPRQEKYNIWNHPDLLSTFVMPPTGENRLPYLTIRSGYEDQAKIYIAQAWPYEFTIASSSELVAGRLFGHGTIYSPVLDRLGDLILIPEKDAYFWFWKHKENNLLSRHGGLSRAEMLVPLVAMQI